MFVQNKKNGVTVKAYRGDAMSLLAFNLEKNLNKENFVGFSIACQPEGAEKYFLFNRINFGGTSELTTSEYAPFQKFRWIHVPGDSHLPVNKSKRGNYTYFVTPRYYDKNNDNLFPLDDSLTVDVTLEVDRFTDGPLELSFTRSYVNSQAYVRRFGMDNKIVPDGTWLFDTSMLFTKFNSLSYTYEDLYQYLGFTARETILDFLNEALNDNSIKIEMFAYDFNEPDVADLCLKLAKAKRLRVILDDSVEVDSKTKVKKGHGVPDSDESDFEKKFKSTGNTEIVRGHFSRLQHNKILIMLKGKSAVKVLTGSTNFSITGLCVNANHVAVFNNSKIAGLYHNVFENSFGEEKMRSFRKTAYAKAKAFNFSTKNQSSIDITFSPHSAADADTILSRVAKSINTAKKCVLFSVMQISGSGGPVMPALQNIQNKTSVFSYGVSDRVKAVSLYKPGSKRGILVDAKEITKSLPKPFNEEVDYNAHKIHHKFVVVDCFTSNACVYFGSSNLALGGEKQNGDNLICVKDRDIAAVFAIEALRLVDHFHFRAKSRQTKKSSGPLRLSKTNDWAKPYFDSKDIKYVDRNLFA